MLFPKKPGSFYHLSKVHDSHNLEFGSRVWGLRVTDLNQGVVYGTETTLAPFGDDELRTSFHYDAVFGTVLNRFVVQASIGMPLTLYGSGMQTRGFLNIQDTIKCVQLVADDPPSAGTFRVFNQFTEQFSVSQLAEIVKEAGEERGLNVEVQHLKNPRAEQEEHFYEARHSNLLDLGLVPILLTRELVGQMVDEVIRHRSRVVRDSLLPSIPWNQHA